MPSFSAVWLDLPSVPSTVRHNMVLSVLWSMLSTNYRIISTIFFYDPMSLWWSHHSLSASGARRDHACVDRLAPPTWLRSLLGLVACVSYVFQWGYDEKQPSIVSLGTTSRLSGNQLEDDEISACVLSLSCIRPISLLKVDIGAVPGRRWGGSSL